MSIISHVPRLIAAKFGGEDNVNLKQIERETGLAYLTVSAWMKGRYERIDFPTLEKWCKYLGAQPGDLFSYVPDPDTGT